VAEIADPPETSAGTGRAGRLDSLQRCRLEAARLYRDGRAGRISAGDCSKLASVLSLVAQLLERSELEQRLARLEARLP
jgi:hypothetical protein